MIKHISLTIVLAVAITNVVAQRQVTYGNGNRLAKEDVRIPAGDSWVLSSLDPDSFVEVLTPTKANLLIARPAGATNEKLVRVTLNDGTPTKDDVVSVIVQLPLILESGSHLIFTNSPGSFTLVNELHE